MYGWLLESVQHYISAECGEEIWDTILREAGARNTVFSATQQYPDALMLRLATCLARLFNQDPNSPAESRPSSPCRPSLVTRKASSLKSKPPPKRSNTVHTDGRTYRCPFSEAIALTAATKKEIEKYNSKEEIGLTPAQLISKERINEGMELEIVSKKTKDYHRRSTSDACESSVNNCDNFVPPCKSGEGKKKAQKEIEKSPKKKSQKENKSMSPKKFQKDDELTTSPKKDQKESEPTASNSANLDAGKTPSTLKSKQRKTSVTLALDVYRRRGSGNPSRPRLNSLSHITAIGDKFNTLKEKFGTPDKVMHFFGRCFVKFFSYYGYDTMIRATGRYFCTFLQSVDSIHQRMRFTFPRMRSPSMQLTRAHHHGAEIVYSTTRVGFTHYLMGQLYEIAEDIFSLNLSVSIVKEGMEGNYYVAVLRLEFDNTDYVQSLMARKNIPCSLPPVPVCLFLQLFPFGVLLDRKMRIISAGSKLVEAWGGPYSRIEKQPVGDILRLRKPKTAFTWEKVTCMQTMTFELELIRYRAKIAIDARRGSQGARAVLFKGPIYLLEEIDALIFLCSPIFNNLDELRQADLFLADLNGHGLSKEMLLHGWQHLSRLELLFEKAENRSLTLEKSHRLRDQWKSKGDQLLYSMIPKSIACHLRSGKDPMAACQAFDSVTVMFCGLQLAEAGTRADVMQTVAYMNDVYSKIDRLLDGHRVYKAIERIKNVETVGTVYMLVSGAPEKHRAHAAAAASAALAIARALPVLTIGVHSGSCVAGVLGLKLPRFCLVGDTVNTASRMQTTSEPGKIQVSSQTASELPAKFRLRRRGLIKVKGKGMMETFWLEAELEEDDQDEALMLFSALCGEE